MGKLAAARIKLYLGLFSRTIIELKLGCALGKKRETPSVAGFWSETCRSAGRVAGLHRRQLTYSANTVPKTGHTTVGYASGHGPGHSPPCYVAGAGTMVTLPSLLFLLFCSFEEHLGGNTAPLHETVLKVK